MRKKVGRIYQRVLSVSIRLRITRLEIGVLRNQILIIIGVPNAIYVVSSAQMVQLHSMKRVIQPLIYSTAKVVEYVLKNAHLQPSRWSAINKILFT